jgi:putative tryptophan/tyrosine transport system substrate-binding protein
MRRREFAAGIAGALALPMWASAQQPNRVRRIAVLMGYEAADQEARQRLNAFKQRLDALGWTDGRNISFDDRWLSGDPEQIRRNAAPLVASSPDLILASSTPVVRELLRKTRAIPIIFVSVSDPVGEGFITSLSSPGGNVTGFTNLEPSLGGKWVELLKEAVPSLTRVAALFSPRTAAGRGSYYGKTFAAAASRFGVQAVLAPADDIFELENVMTNVVAEPGSALVVMPDIFTVVHRDRIIAFATYPASPRFIPTAILPQLAASWPTVPLPPTSWTNTAARRITPTVSFTATHRVSFRWRHLPYSSLQSTSKQQRS